MRSKKFNILILGASYGSLFGTKCLMAGHDVTLVCRGATAARAIAGGAPVVERVDKLVQLVGRQHGIAHPAIDRTVALIDALIARNAACAA